ncbi:hypothetical protein [Streptomyces litchfieldiae]|uniref:Uncharacterized protein n=1 Tax=Streptomyces litchfieldiae TaxID=3075543 RepID=A0ABU2MNP2_9ACTN|nr:hypothetical protein [Streptomyces sp. DSM 44938]MDT0343226.1 hypothetical protein [Streptomyces sp. DSM 44938]
MHTYFDVPDFFTGFPVGMTAEETYAYAHTYIDSLKPEGEEAEQRILREIRGLSEILMQTGALYAGAAVQVIGNEPSLATLTVTVQGFRYGDDARIAAEGAMHSLIAARGREWTGQVRDLPCGPAAIVTGTRAHRVPADETTQLPVAELQAFVPVPEHQTLPQQCMLTVTFTTPSIRHWQAYMPSVVRLLRSITFTTTASEERPHALS